VKCLLLSSSILRCVLLAILLGAIAPWSAGGSALSLSEATGKGRSFLVSLLDPDLGLLPEYRGAKVYWLFHDNYLAAKVLNVSHPKVARTIRAALDREGVAHSGKIELLFGEAEKPLPFRQYQLRVVRRVAEKVIRTEAATDHLLENWNQYADLLLMACIAESDPPTVRHHWDMAMRLWDGQGFLDAAARHDRRYSTYKLGLAMIAARHVSPPAKVPEGLLDKLLALQDDSGGWNTDYDKTGQKLGLANVETTCLAILGLEALATNEKPSGK
jgi:hypothetical protein